MCGVSRPYRVLPILVTLFVFAIGANEAHAQARWLTTKTKPFTSGKKATEVLDELATAHKFKVTYSEPEAKSTAESAIVYGNLEGLPLSTTVNLICSNLIADNTYPWTADKTTLTISTERTMVSVTYDISRISGVLNDADEFRYALMTAVNAEWEDPESPTDPASTMGAIEELTPATVTIKQSSAVHAEVANILNKLQIAASGAQKEEKSAADKKIEKVLEKQMSVDAGQMSWLDLFGTVFTENKVPFLVAASALEKGFDPSATITPEGKKQKIRETLEPLLSEHKVKLVVDSGAILVTSLEEDSPDFSTEIYNIRKFLNTTTAAEVSAKIMEIEGLKIDDPVELGPFLIISGSSEDHKKVADAVAGK